MTTQDLFDRAEARYKHARAIIADMIEYVHRGQPDFDARAAYCQFDIIVQFILLKVALADGKFLEIEGEFIDRITDSYDILLLFDNHDDDYNWSFAGAFMDFEQVEFLVNKVEQLASNHIFAFSEMFAEVDLVERSKNYIQELYHCIKDIATCFIMADGQSTKREIEIAVQVVRECLTEPWLAKQRKLKTKK